MADDTRYRPYRPTQYERLLRRQASKYQGRIEREIERFLADALGADGYVTDAQINASQAKIRHYINEFGSYAKEWENEKLTAYYEKQTKIADGELEQSRIDLEETLRTGAKRLHTRGYKGVTRSFNDHFGRLVDTVAREVNDIYASVQRQSALYGFQDTDNIKKVIRNMREEFQRNGITVFRDKRGRAWNMKRYTDMAGRTVTAEARRAAHEMEFLAHGQDLVRVNVVSVGGYETCKYCKPWEGKVLSLTGNTPGYPTMAEARARKLFHPNCLHWFTIVLEEDIPESERRPLR